MPKGWLPAVGISISEMLPPGMIRPILLTPNSVNHAAPSGPGAILRGSALPSGRKYPKLPL
jgi:hypothetical protein